MQYISVATLSAALYCVSVLWKEQPIFQHIYEGNLIVRNLSSILLAYGISNSVKQALEAEIRDRNRLSLRNESTESSLINDFCEEIN